MHRGHNYGRGGGGWRGNHGRKHGGKGWDSNGKWDFSPLCVCTMNSEHVLLMRATE